MNLVAYWGLRYLLERGIRVFRAGQGGGVFVVELIMGIIGGDGMVGWIRGLVGGMLAVVE